MNGNLTFAISTVLAQDGGLDWDNPLLSFRVMLCTSAYVPRVTDEHVSSVTHELSGTGYLRLGLSSRTVAYDSLNARVDNSATSATWAAINAGTAAWAVVYKFVTNDADSILICAIDLRTPAHPSGIATTGAALTLNWGGTSPTGRVFSAFGVMHTGGIQIADRFDDAKPAASVVSFKGVHVGSDGKSVDTGCVDVLEYTEAAGIVDPSTEDCSAAILAAHAGRNGKRVHFPAGRYLCNAGVVDLTSADPVTITGDGYETVIEFVGSGDSIGWKGRSSNCHIKGVRFTGVCSEVLAFLRPASTNIADCTIEDCWISGGTTGAFPAGVYFEGVDRGRVFNTVISGNGVPGVRAIGSVNVTDTSNGSRDIAPGEITFTNSVTRATYTNDEAFTLGALTTANVAVTSVDAGNSNAAISEITQLDLADATCTNPVAVTGTNVHGYDILYGFTDNTGAEVRGCVITCGNTYIAIAAFSSSDGNFSGNTIDGGGAKNGLYANSGYGIMSYHPSGLIPDRTSKQSRISNNDIRNCAGSGIYVQGAPNTVVADNICVDCGLRQSPTSLPVGGIASTNADHIVVCGNAIKGGGEAGITIATGRYQGCFGNVIESPRTYGIFVRGVCDGGAIVSNTIKSTGNSGVLCNASSGVVVSGNTITDPAADGIDIGGATGCIVDGNTIAGATSHAILAITGSGHRITNNHTQSAAFDIYLDADRCEVSGNTCAPTSGVALHVFSDYNTIRDNRWVSGTVVKGGTGNLYVGNRDGDGLELDVLGRSFVDHGAITGGALAIDGIAGAKHEAVLSSPTTAITFANVHDGAEFELHLIQDGPGSRLATWPASVRFSGGAPTLSTGGLKRDVVKLTAIEENDAMTAQPSLGYALDWLELWDADAGVALTGSDIDSWTGTINSYVLTPPGNKPTLDTTGINSAKAIKFVRASSQWLTNTTTSALYSAANGVNPTLSVVVQALCASAPNAASFWFWGVTGGAVAHRFEFETIDTTHVQLHDNGSSGLALTQFAIPSLTAAPHILLATTIGTSQHLYVDGALNATAGTMSATSRTATRFNVGAYSNGSAGFFFDGWIRRIGILRSVPTANDIRAIQNAWSGT